MGSINGYSVLVTGGGSGIGEAAAAKLAADGANVMICGRTEEKLIAAVERIKARCRRHDRRPRSRRCHR